MSMMQNKNFHLIQNALHLYMGPTNSLCHSLLSIAAIKNRDKKKIKKKKNLGQKEFLCLILPRPSLRGLF